MLGACVIGTQKTHMKAADQAAGGGQEETQQLWKMLGVLALNSLQAESGSIICNPSRE